MGKLFVYSPQHIKSNSPIKLQSCLHFRGIWNQDKWTRDSRNIENISARTSPRRISNHNSFAEMKLGCKVVTSLIVLDTSPRVLSVDEKNRTESTSKLFHASTLRKLPLFVVNDTGVISHEWVTPKTCNSHLDKAMNDWRLHFLHGPSLRYTFAASLWQKGSLAISLMFHFLLFATHATLPQNITWSEISTIGRRVWAQRWSVGKFCARWELRQTYGNIFYWYWFMGSARTLCQIFLRGYQGALS